MKYIIFYCVLFVMTSSSLGAPQIHPLSDEFIDLINKKQTTWKAGRNFNSNTPLSYLKGLTGALSTNNDVFKQRVKTLEKNSKNIPEYFDARERWPECASIIGSIWDQGSCGSCWAFGAAEAMSDRICIFSNATVKINISVEDILSCCTECGSGCGGGFADRAWKYWAYRGIVTGGGYHSHEGCKSYTIEPCEHNTEGPRLKCGDLKPTPTCKKTCDNDSLIYKNDLRFGSQYYVDSSETQIRNEIFDNGPVEAQFHVYEDFVHYKSGVYKYTAGKKIGGHAIKILGWGIENGTPYWLVANSWNSDWGDNGYFKIFRGENECGIEAHVVAGFPVF